MYFYVKRRLYILSGVNRLTVFCTAIALDFILLSYLPTYLLTYLLVCPQKNSLCSLKITLLFVTTTEANMMLTYLITYLHIGSR